MLTSCYLCGGQSHRQRLGKVRDAHDISILECETCGLVFLSANKAENPTFYRESGMHGGDLPVVDNWLRDCERDDQRRFEHLKGLIINNSVLDFGCGPGGFLLKARTIAGKVAGIELEERLQTHFEQIGLKVFPGLDRVSDGVVYDLITAFHVMEHLEDPSAVLQRLATKLSEEGRLIIEVPSADDALLTLYESHPFSEFTYWSCHLYLFNAATLRLLSKKAGLQVEVIQHVQRYPLANHLYWLAKGKPGGHQFWSFLSNEDLERSYEASLAAIGKTDTLVAILRP